VIATVPKNRYHRPGQVPKPLSPPRRVPANSAVVDCHCLSENAAAGAGLASSPPPAVLPLIVLLVIVPPPEIPPPGEACEVTGDCAACNCERSVTKIDAAAVSFLWRWRNGKVPTHRRVDNCQRPAIDATADAFAGFTSAVVSYDAVEDRQRCRRWKCRPVAAVSGEMWCWRESWALVTERAGEVVHCPNATANSKRVNMHRVEARNPQERY
jgi:hypothetical protein